MYQVKESGRQVREMVEEVILLDDDDDDIVVVPSSSSFTSPKNKSQPVPIDDEVIILDDLPGYVPSSSTPSSRRRQKRVAEDDCVVIVEDGDGETDAIFPLKQSDVISKHTSQKIKLEISAIYDALKKLVKGLTHQTTSKLRSEDDEVTVRKHLTQRVAYQWHYSHPSNYKKLRLNIETKNNITKSVLGEVIVEIPSQRDLIFDVIFPSNFPQIAFTIEPLCSLPPMHFVSILAHPVLTNETYWKDSFCGVGSKGSSCLLEIFQSILRGLDRDNAAEHWHIASEPILGGIYGQVDLMTVPNTANTMEYLIAELATLYIPSLQDYQDLPNLIQSYFPPDLCVCLGMSKSATPSTTSGKGIGYSVSQQVAPQAAKYIYEGKGKQLVNQITDKFMMFILPRMRKNIKNKDVIQHGKLQDALLDWLETCQRSIETSAEQGNAMITLLDEVDGNTPTKSFGVGSSNNALQPHWHRLFWLLASPLLDMIVAILKESSKEEFFRQSVYYSSLFAMALRMEVIWQTVKEIHGKKSLEDEDDIVIQKHKQEQLILDHVHQTLRLIYRRLLDIDRLSLFDEGKSKQRLQEIHEFSNLYVAIVEGKDVIKTTIGNEASSSSSSSSSHQVTSNKNNSSDQDAKKQEEGPKVIFSAERVQRVEGLERLHYYFPKPNSPYQSSSSSSSDHSNKIHKCSKKWYKELACIDENLPQEITLFVSENHPNYLIAVMHIINDSCPYYAGSYIFHILIPEKYPSESPKMHLMTTGDGTVRFNPNLYNCGKVCLSLLGTWAGEPWSPTTSNLTQVLTSILYLIFTDEPYFNEPGYASCRGTSSGNQQSAAYDYNLMVQNMEYAISYHLKKFQVAPTNKQVDKTYLYGGYSEDVLMEIMDYYQNNWNTILFPTLQDKFTKWNKYGTNTHLLGRLQTTNNTINHILSAYSSPTKKV